jgi:hypothetical protein
LKGKGERAGEGEGEGEGERKGREPECQWSGCKEECEE